MPPRLRLAPGERPLAWASDDEGRWYVGTDRALHLPEGEGYRVLPWEQVERAGWQQDAGRLVVVEVADWGDREVQTEISVADPGRLPELLQERVTKSVVSTSYTPLEGRQGLTVVARRSPTGAGPIAWSYVLSRGLDPADPEIAALASRAREVAEAELRGSI